MSIIGSLPVAATDLPVAASSAASGVTGAIGGFFEALFETATDFGVEIAARGRQELLDDIFGPSIPIDQFNGTPGQEPGGSAAPANATPNLFGIPTDQALLVGGGALALIALVLLIRN